MFYRIIILSLIVLSTSTCKTQSCFSLPEYFESYEDAISKIKKSSFSFSEKINTIKSSWINTAEYSSCDTQKGFLIININSRSYIYQDLPIEIWKEFKAANSHGKYYNTYIKGRYKIKIYSK
jgi:hypothetical protein